VRAFFSVLFVFLLTAAATAQQPSSNWIFGVNGEDIVLEIGGGAKVVPAYPGADEYTVLPWPIVDLRFLRLPGIGSFGGGAETGFKIAPSFGFVRKRDASEYSDLNGLNDVDFAVEVGGQVSYRHGMVRAIGAVRRGFGGYEGWVGEFGLDAVLDPTPDLTISVGPRVYLASDGYMDTYFGVTPAEAAASGLAAFDADGWLRGAGIEAEGRYAISRHWAIRGEAGYERLLGDAADSPISRAGSRNQFNVALGLSYLFGLDLFDN
jgi:outer membrane protein